MYNIAEEYKIQERVKNTIKRIWHQLTDDEIAAFEEARDIFFLAVRKKHGLLRVQAEMILNDLKKGLHEAA